MILFWRGWGIIVPIIIFLCGLVAYKLAGGTDESWKQHSYPLAGALLVAAGLIWLADRYFYRNPDGRIFIDEKTGQRFRRVPTHDLFFLRLKWWSLVCIGLAVLVLIAW
jgi:hypothetical protein